jgi:hypothetical protein
MDEIKWLPTGQQSKTHDWYVDGKIATVIAMGAKGKKIAALRMLLWDGTQRDFPFINGVCEGVEYQEKKSHE